jgi:predicted Ser/Thr protein kinase
VTADEDPLPPLTTLRDSPTTARPREAAPARADFPATSLRAVDPATSLHAVDPATSLRAVDPAETAGGSAPAEFEVGSIIKNRFELKTLVGRGGMGMVFSALDRRKAEARDPNPDVAVKILNSSFAQHPDAFVALQREASKAQSLAHPNIATVFDFDRDGGSVFITMELLRGRSLEDVIRGARNRGIERKAALPVIRGIAEGLSYAHRKGIVHSDLKPANIFLAENGSPKILDFGIARAVPSAADAGPKDQFDAGTLGAYTEGYATEEMVQGADPAPADDIYALGIIVYELLTGKHPYARKTAAEARAAGAAPAPIRSLRRREWQTLARSLAFDRAKRPRDATEFLRQFFGATQLRNALIAATLLLAIASGYLWYQNYRQSGPAVAFEDLPAATQQKVKADLADGDTAWGFYAQQKIPNALTDSVSAFADAYRWHPRDREAVRGLKRAADEMLKLERARGDPDGLHATARNLAESSEFLKTYPPVVNAIGQ